MNNMKLPFNHGVIYKYIDYQSFYKKLFHLLDKKTLKKYDTSLIVLLLGANTHLSKSYPTYINREYETLFDKGRYEFDTPNATNQIYIIITEQVLWIFLKKNDKSLDLRSDIELVFGDSISPIKVTSKPFIKYIFEENHSNNLMDITIDGLNFLDELEEESYSGSFINDNEIFEEIIKSDHLNILHVKFQPLNYNAMVTFRLPNIIEFNKHIKLDLLIELIISISNQIRKFSKKGGG